MVSTKARATLISSMPLPAIVSRRSVALPAGFTVWRSHLMAAFLVTCGLDLALKNSGPRVQGWKDCGVGISASGREPLCSRMGGRNLQVGLIRPERVSLRCRRRRNLPGSTLARKGDVHLWDATTGRMLWSRQGHSKVVECVAFAPDGESVASGGMDGVLKVWAGRAIREGIMGGEARPGTLGMGACSRSHSRRTANT